MDLRSPITNSEHPSRDGTAGSVADLDRFLTAQSRLYPLALGEIQRGRKRSHWIWFILPQLRALGASARSREYGIADLAEAKAYLAHPLLGARLRECVAALCTHTGSSATAILGPVDALKFRSCLTLFAAAAEDPQLFDDALHQFFAGERDAETIRLLATIPVDGGRLG
ncbi:MAG: DUF1810 domain-containing protein [Gammaproteobacteria bacterium]